MNRDKYFQDLAHVIGAVLLGSLFFFDIIGVFGLGFAIAGLLLFVIGAVAIFRAFPSKGTHV